MSSALLHTHFFKNHCRFHTAALGCASLLLSLGFSACGTDLAQFTTLVSFEGAGNGAFPSSALVQGADGNLYGTTAAGGRYGAGTIFRLTPQGAVQTLYSFSGKSDGGSPVAGLIKGPDGSLFGTTEASGRYYDGSEAHIDFGTVYRIGPDGLFTHLFSFQGTNGCNPWSAGELIIGADGNLYGTTVRGGAAPGASSPWYGFGTIFCLTTNGSFRSLCSFDGVENSTPHAGLTLGREGAFYGTTSLGGGAGTVFRATADGTLATLARFGFTNGYAPGSQLLLGADGDFYGTTLHGGTSATVPIPGQQSYGYGTIFRLSPNGTLTTLFSFNGTNGANPCGALIQATDGNLYGTTAAGDPSTNALGTTLGNGTIFRLDRTGAFTVLHWFDQVTGANPLSGLIQGADGSFYGTTSGGGRAGMGTIFKLTVALAPLIDPVILAQGKIWLKWKAVEGRTYQIQYSSEVSQGEWGNLGLPLPATQGSMSATDVVMPNSHRFYRAVLLP